MSLAFTENFMRLKLSFLAKSLSTFTVLAGLRSIEFKYLTKHPLKHSLSFWILIKTFLGLFF